MDKRKVITAYRLGLMSAQECSQILGLDNPQLLCHVPGMEPAEAGKSKKQSVRM